MSLVHRAFAVVCGIAALAMAAGAAAQCSLTCPSNQTTSNAVNQCGAVVAYPAPQTTGTCGTVTVSPASGAFYPVGTTTVTANASGAPQPSCQFTITVNDTQPPTVTAPANVTIATANVPAVVNFPAPTFSDNCPNPSLAVVPPSGSSFPAGTTSVVSTVTDGSSNSASATFTVTIVPLQLPEPIPALGALSLAALAAGVGAFAIRRMRRG
jgi:hypothetical protein